MKRIVFGLMMLMSLVACNKMKTSDAEQKTVDTVDVKKDSWATDSVASPPKAADGLFDDFIYSFMRNPRFQNERIQFPLANVVDGVNTPIQAKDWKFDHLYVKQDVYTLIFDNARSVKAEKDTTLRHVVVEWVYLNKQRVKQYIFNKIDGQWCLTGIDQHRMDKNINSDFYSFYRHFSTSMAYQKKHILNPFYFKTYDYDNFQNIEGLLDVNQWPDYRPHLPSGTITNINYGQSYGNANRRVLMICSQGAGMGCSLTFVRKGKTWMLERLEN